MAISGADWISATDPFILALAHSWSGFGGGTTVVSLTDSHGFINGITDDKDIQELIFVKDADTSNSFHATSAETEIFSFLDYLNEWPLFDENLSGSYNPLVTHDLIQQDTKVCNIVADGKSSGSVQYSLYAYSAYAWVEKDPAQVIFSWIAHHLPLGVSAKDFLDQTALQAASDYYDENPIDLVLIREVGISIADQIKKLMVGTADFLSVRPSESTGEVQLAVMPRRGLPDRPTVIDLESESISKYTMRPTDLFTLDEVICNFGNSILQTVIPRAVEDTNSSQPVNYPSETINTVKQKVGGVDELRSATVDAPYITRKATVLNHLDVGFWKDDQDELEVEFADWTHLNFEVGDQVHFLGEGYDGTEDFVCTEKNLDIDTMKASARFIQIHGVKGKTPMYADEGNLILSLRQNSLGDHEDGVTTFPASILQRNSPRSVDRWWDESGNYFQAVEHIRGIPPAVPKMDLDVRNRWPGLATSGLMGLEFVDDNNSGYNKIGTAGVSNYTFYWAGEVTGNYAASAGYLLDCNGASDIIFAVSGNGAGSGTHDTYQFYDGLWRGTAALQSGWQILVFVLNSAGSKIRRNGVDLETGLSYTQRQIDNTGTFGLMADSGGTFANVAGNHLEFHLFDTAHSDATVELIEAHLAEKYNITI